jgi:hypothetical protein
LRFKGSGRCARPVSAETGSRFGRRNGRLPGSREAAADRRGKASKGSRPSVREGSAILALLVLAAPGFLVVLALLLLAVLVVALPTLLLLTVLALALAALLLLTGLVVALAALLLLAILVVTHAALLAGTLATLLLLAALLTGALAALLLLAAALALLVLVAVLIVVSHDQASSLNCVARPGVNGLAAKRAARGARSS